MIPKNVKYANKIVQKVLEKIPKYRILIDIKAQKDLLASKIPRDPKAA